MDLRRAEPARPEDRPAGATAGATNSATNMVDDKRQPRGDLPIAVKVGSLAIYWFRG